MNVFVTLNDIRLKPELYLGAKNITFLYHFINGYLFNVDLKKDSISHKFRELHFWLPKETHIEVENWVENLLIKTAGDQEEALNLFFHYLEKFKAEVIEYK
jgi:hypothetical protein